MAAGPSGGRDGGARFTAGRPRPGKAGDCQQATPWAQDRGPAPRQPPPHSVVLQAEASAGTAEVVTGAAVVSRLQERRGA